MAWQLQHPQQCGGCLTTDKPWTLTACLLLRHARREKPKDVIQYLEEEGVVKLGQFDIQVCAQPSCWSHAAVLCCWPNTPAAATAAVIAPAAARRSTACPRNTPRTMLFCVVMCRLQDAIAFRAFEKDNILTMGTDHYEV